MLLGPIVFCERAIITLKIQLDTNEETIEKGGRDPPKIFGGWTARVEVDGIGGLFESC